MPKPDIITPAPTHQPHLIRLVVSSGQNRMELEGADLSLASHEVQALIAKVFEAGSSQQSVIDALTKQLSDSSAKLANSVADNTPSV